MNETLYRTLKKMIERGNTDGIREKLDVFYAVNSLSLAWYEELMSMVTGNYYPIG